VEEVESAQAPGSKAATARFRGPVPGPGPTAGRTWADLAVLAFIALLVLARSLHREAVFDLHLWDESFYLLNGIRLLTVGFPTPEWGPLYAAWYWLESLLIHDRIALYYANWAFLLAANLVVAWLVMRKLGVGFLVTVGALTALAFAGAFDSIANIQMLASAILGLAILVALGRRTLSGAFSAAASMVAVGVFVRPDLAVAFAALLTGTCISAVVERSLWRPAIPAGIALVACLAFGNPFGGNQARAFVAFGQHYAKNANAAAPPQARIQRPDVDWYRFVVADFGRVESVRDAILANPAAFMWHIGQNACRLASRLAGPVTPGVPGGGVMGWGLLLALVAGAAASLRKHDRTALLLAAVAASAVLGEAASALLVFPNEPYLAIPVLAVVALGLSGIRTWRPRRDAALAGAAAALVLAIAPGRTSAAPWYVPVERAPTPEAVCPGCPYGAAVANSIAWIRAAPGARFLILSDFPASIAYSPNWQADGFGFDRCPELIRCIDELGAVTIDPAFVEFYSIRSDPLLPILLTNPAALGLSDKRVLAQNVLLLAKTGLLEPGAPRN
jgi:hypothetical protein